LAEDFSEVSKQRIMILMLAEFGGKGEG